MNLKEDYCSFELSKLLKEKGFDCDCKGYDVVTGVTTIHNWKSVDGLTPCCTHQLAMKWLREECKVFIGAKYNPYYKQFKVQITLMDYSKEAIIRGAEVEINNFDNMFFDTYEEAVEDAIKFTLLNLI